MAIAPELKVGVFISIFTSDGYKDPTESAFTAQAMDLLIPAFEEVLWTLQKVLQHQTLCVRCSFALCCQPVPLPPDEWKYEGMFYVDPMEHIGASIDIKVISGKLTVRFIPDPGTVGVAVSENGNRTRSALSNSKKQSSSSRNLDKLKQVGTLADDDMVYLSPTPGAFVFVSAVAIAMIHAVFCVRVCVAVSDLIFHMHLLNPNIACRWLNDGPDQELVYFAIDTITFRMESVIIFGDLYQRIL